MDSTSIWHWLVIFLIVAAFFATLIGAFSMDGALHAREPGVRPFVWGYWIGLVAVIQGGLLVLIGLMGVIAPRGIEAGNQDSNALLGVFFFVSAGLASAWVGWRALRRRRWAWVVLTVVSFNPILWLVNGVYGARRWQELK